MGEIAEWRAGGEGETGEDAEHLEVVQGVVVGDGHGHGEYAGAHGAFAQRDPDPNAVPTVGGDRRGGDERAAGHRGGDLFLHEHDPGGAGGHRDQRPMGEVGQVDDRVGARHRLQCHLQSRVQLGVDTAAQHGQRG